MKYKHVFLFFFCALYSLIGFSQSLVQRKNFPLLTQLETNKTVRNLLENNLDRVNPISSDGNASIEHIKITDEEVGYFAGQLTKLQSAFPDKFAPIVKYLKNSGSYSLFESSSDNELLSIAWKTEAKSINNIISIYAQGKKPNYPSIDSISFNLSDPKDAQLIIATAQKTFEQNKQKKLFFIPAMKTALAILDLNGRNDAGNYEPMENTINKLAVKAIEKVDWKKYPYSIILVPGIGPENGVALDPLGKEHCDLAAEQYRKGLAPFIMVSGGKVHPFKTQYCEAEEMKKYLVSVVGLPESAIIMEPHARHTTTNLRNASRLIYKYKIPVEKAALVVTDAEQSAGISRMDNRCMKELGNVPYKLGKRLSDTVLEFYAVWTANQINSTEPLDP